MLFLARIIRFVKSRWFYAKCYVSRRGLTIINDDGHCRGFLFDTHEFLCKDCPYHVKSKE